MINRKRVILVVSFLLFLTTVQIAKGIVDNSSIYLNLSGNYVWFEKLDYNFGEPVLINLSLNTKNFELYIISENKIYSYTSLNRSIIFIPEKPGNYTAQLIIGNTATGNLSFTVSLGNQPSIFTDKNEYYLGEPILIYLDNIDENYAISIHSESSAYNFIGTVKSPLEFKPINAGFYKINVKNKNEGIIISKNFTVKAPDKSEGKISIYTDKKTYYLGELASIHLNFTKKDSYVFYITSEDSIYQFLGILDESIAFRPKSAGKYIIKIEEADKILASYSFDVIEKGKEKPLDIFYFGKDLYELGEDVNIYLNFNIPFLEILLENENYNFYNLSENLIFTPNKTGIYLVNAYIENTTLTKIFKIKEREEKFDYYFDLSEDIIIDFDLKPIVDNKRTILNILFGTSPIDKIVFYVENYSNNLGFNLTAEQISKEYFRVKIKSNHAIKPDVYNLVAEVTIDDEIFGDRKIFKWGYANFTYTILNKTLNQAINESYDKGFEFIKKYVNHSFSIYEDAVIVVDFTDLIDVERDILDLALKKSKLEQLIVYVEGHEFDNNFNLSIEHLEFDKFNVTIKKNDNINPDVYKLIAVGNIGNDTFIKEKIFNLGITDSSYFFERFQFKILKNLTTVENKIIMDETIILNETILNQTITNKALINKTEKSAILDKLTQIQNITLYTDKKSYILGEIVYIYPNENISRLQIVHNNTILYVLDFKPNISFAPLSEGYYRIEASVTGLEGALTTNFSVNAVNAPLNLIKRELKKLDFGLRNSKKEKIEADIRFYDKNNLIKEIKERRASSSAESDFSILEDKYDVEIAPINSPIKKIRINELNFNGSLDFGIDDVPEKIKKLENKDVVEVYALDPTKISFSKAIVSIVAKGTELYKCKDWNFEAQACLGSWEKIMDLTPGKEYTFVLNAEDPGFAETGLASINTNKSIYRLNEEVGIIIVILDKDGHLVSGANVILNITKPNNSTTSFSTNSGTIYEAEMGIYKSIYSNTNLEGNYSLYVKAIDSNVDNSMASFFIVKQSYEFDILRQTPVTTDPWKGPFTSSIKITSFTNSPIFNFSEALPINFTLIDNNNAIVAIENNKKILTWVNLNNNSLVSYSAKPPLLSPELWELGPAIVKYSNNKFEEPKPWFLAVDPLCAPNCPTNTKGESGEVILSTSQTEVDVDLINEYALNKTFLIARHHAAATPTGAGVASDEHTANVRFLDNNTIRINRYASNARDSRATYSIIQADNIQVWNFTQELLSGQNRTNVTLSPSLPSSYNTKCFVELWRNTRVASADADCMATAQVVSNITNTTNLNLRRITTPAGCTGSTAGNTSGFVVCFLDSTTVQTNETVADIESGTTVALQSAVDRTRAWLTFDFMVDDSGVEQVSVRGNITANNQLTFYRNTGETTAGTVTLRWYVIEFESGNGALVERQGRNAIDDAVTVLNITFNNTFNMNRTLAHCSENHDGDEGVTFPREWWSGFFVNSTAITQNRGRTGGNGDFTDHQCQAIQWPNATTFETGVDDVKPRINGSLNNSQPQKDYLVNFTANVTDETALSFCQFIVNQSTNGAKEFFNKSVSGTSDQCSQNFTIALDTGSVINFTALVNDTNNNINSTQQIITVRGSPIVTLNSPANNSIETDLNVSLKCSASDDSDVKNLTVYTNTTGQFAENTSAIFSGASDVSVSFIFNLSVPTEMLFIWNCLSFDDESQSRFASANYTVRARIPAEGFTDITSISNISNRTSGRGVCAEDYNKNGLVDVILLGDNQGGINLFNNTGSNFFKNDTNSLSHYSLAGRSCSVGDFNNDNFPDVITASDLILYKNNKNSTFNCTDSENDQACQGSVLPVISFTGKGIQWFDYNDDSYLDLWAPDTSGAYIFENNGDGNFSLVTIGSDTIDEYTAVADYDNDGNLDLFAVDGNTHIIYKNNGNSTFTKVDAGSIGLANRTRGSGEDAEDFHLGFGDYDNDGDLDIFITSTGITEKNFFENDGDGTFTERTVAANLPTDDIGTNPVFGDYNNDGYLDLLIGGKGIYKNNKDGTFSDASSNLSITSVPESAQFADIDNDGDLDIVGQNKSGISIVYRNDLNDPNYLKIVVRGLGNATRHNFSNVDAIGSKIRVYNSSNNLVCFREISGGSSYGQGPKMQHCGLKSSLTYNVSVEFPSGLSKNVTVAPSSASLTIGEIQITQAIQINESEMPPTITLVLPEANEVDSDGLDVLFICNATDDIDLANISLFTNYSGNFTINQTLNLNMNSDIRNTTNFSVNFSANIIAWNCLAYDAAGNSAFAVQNRTLSVGSDTLSVDVYTDSTIYGTNEIARITVNATNRAGGPLNATGATDIIFGTSTTQWWNSSFIFRKPIFLSYNQHHANVTVQVNVTGFDNDIVSCVNDTRIVKNASTSNELINSTIVEGDNSTYCLIRFMAEVHNANESNYHVYYTNNTRHNPGFRLGAGLLVKNTQKGTASLPIGTTATTLEITQVNLTRSFLVFNVQEDNNRPDNGLVRGNITANATNLKFIREASATAVTIQWYVTEFESGINVQRGSAPLSASPLNIPINSVNVNRSFALTSWDDGGANYGSDDFIKVNISSPTNLRITASAINSVDVEWQVIEFLNDARVQQGDIDFASGDVVQTAAIDPVNLNRSFVLITSTSSVNGVVQNFLRAGLEDASTAIFERETSGSALTLTYFVVEFDTSAVQSGTLNFTGTQTLKDVPINSVDVSKSIAFLSGNQKGGTTDYSADDNPGTGWFTTNITSATNLEIRRGINTESALSNLTWFVVEFYGADTVKSSIGSEQKIVIKNINDTENDGYHIINFSTSNQQVGSYSVVSVAAKPNYNDAKDYTFFNITSGGEVPVITVTAPVSGSNLNNAQIDLNATTSKAATCKYSTNQLFDYDTQGTTFSTTGSTSHSTNLGALAEGSHTLYIKCRDTVGNTNNNENQGSTTFTVDRSPPSITLNSPSNNSNQTSSTITFSWTATDNLDASLTCNLTVNSVVEGVNLQSQSGVQTDYTIALSNGNYSWNATCIDDAINYNVSSTYRFGLSIIDMVLSLQTANVSYKQNRYVNLTKKRIFQSGDVESSTQSTFFPINTHIYVPNETTNRAFYIEEDCNGGTVPPSDGPDPSCGGDHQEFTSTEYNSASVSDNVDVSMACGGNDEDYNLYNISLDEDTVSIISMNWSFEGALSATASTTLEFFLWNYSSSSWSRCAADFASTSDTFVNCSVSRNATDFVDSTTKYTTFLTQCDENSGNARTITTDFIQLVVEYYTNKTDGNSSSINYTYEDSTNLTKLSDVNVKIAIVYYNNSVSSSRGNSMPDLEVSFYNGSNYTYKEACSANSITNNGENLPVNCSITITNKTILNAWNLSNNRKFRIRGINLDQALAEQDFINWTDVFVELHTPSEIENVGSANITRRLLLQVLKNTSSGFITYRTVYNNTLTVAANSSSNLSSFWDTNIFSTDNNPLGAYMAYAALLSTDNTVVLNGDSQPLNDTYIFYIDYLRINITTPLNNSIQDAAGLYINVSLENLTFGTGGNCSYSIDGQPNVTMSNGSQMSYFNLTNTVLVGDHLIQVYCNDTSGEFSSSDVHNFSVQDLTAPVINLTFPLNNSEVADGNVGFIYNITDFTSNISNCTLILDFQDNITNVTVTENVNQVFNVTGLPNGQHRWQVRCTDNSSNKNVALSDEFVFLVGIDNSAPVITLTSPANNTFTQNNDPLFKYTAFDEPVASNIQNCSLILNNKANQTNTTIFTGAGEVNNFTLNNMPVGNYNWSVNCTDISSNKNVGSSKTFNLSIGQDTDFPIVNLIFPSNNITDTDGVLSFTYNVTDLSGGISNCSLIVNNTINQSDNTIQEDTEQSFSVLGFNDGLYVWQVNCTDDSFQRNTNSSLIRNFTVLKLLGMSVQVATDKLVYDKGTEFNESIIINTTTRDSLGTFINTTIVSDVIRGNTTLDWWNSSWSLRKPIFINETSLKNRTNVPMSINITGLNGNISSCNNEIRIIYNKSRMHAATPRKIISGDDLSFCFVMFNANISANATDENNYYVYYNNTNAVAPTDQIIFDVQEYVNATFQSDTEGFVYGDDFYGGTDLPAEADGSREQGQNCPGQFPNGFCLNVSLNTVPTATGPWSGGWNITFNITEPNVIVNITFNFTLALSLTTEAGESVNLSYRNISSGAVITGANIQGSGGNPPPNNHYLNGSINYTEFITKTGLYSFDVGCFLSAVDNANEQGACWIDSVKITVLNGSANGVKASEGPVQQLARRDVNDTDSDGIFFFIFNSTNHSTGIYSVVSVANNPSYTSNYNYTFFEIRTDATPPVVNSVSPDDSFASATSNITFIYNVSDASSNIANCQLIIDNLIIQTNTTVTENTRQNFTRFSIGNGAHTWRVNCTDSLGNKDGSPIRNFDVQVDTLGPSITLVSPADNYNDTNGRLEFSYTVLDQFNGIANCTLLLNNTDNQSVYNVTELQTQTLYSNITDGAYNWSVRCTDNSSNFNVNISLTKRFNVIVDTASPLIDLVYPPNGSQLIKENVTFIYNVTDIISNISNCSIFIDGNLNQTNYTVTENINQTFNVTGIANGYHNWSVLCVDGSENNNSATTGNFTFLISPDANPPIVTLINPPNATEDPDGNITLTYNVTDLVSDIKNCTLFINHSRNLSTLDVPEGSEQSFSLFNVPDGVYIWQVNCTDTALVENTGNSSIRYFIIGADNTPPTITLEAPLNNSNDSDGRLDLQYNVIDFGSNIKNCSMLINDTINQTNTSVAESITQDFIITGFNNGTFKWRISCTDNSSQQNTGSSSFRIFNVVNDVEKPAINLILPSDSASDSDGNVNFIYNVSDELNSISSCSLFIDDSLQQTNTTVQENTNQSFRVTGLGDGTYQWFVNCTDNSDNQNIGKSATRTLIVQNDVAAPTITLINPPDHTLETNSTREFFYNVTDAVSSIASCELILNGAVDQSDNTVSEGILQNFSAAGLTNGQKNWSVNCTDNSENSNEGASSVRNLTVILDSSEPVVNLITPLNNTQNILNNATFYFNVTDINAISNCSIYINGTLNFTKYNVTRDITNNFAINNFNNVTIMWSIGCVDISEDKFRGMSENRTLVIGTDVIAPTITLLNPPNNIQEPDGNVLFEYNVTDFASNIANCSLVINNTINQTNNSVQENIKQNFTLNGVPNGIYIWQVNCTDNSTNLNVGSSEVRNLTIGRDTTAPIVTLISPSNNTIYNSISVLYEYSVSDFASDIKNCTLIINDRLNLTNTTVAEDTSQFFLVIEQEDGNYNWSVNCTDTFNNTGASIKFNLSVFRPKQILVNVSVNSSSFEQGAAAGIIVNVTNASFAPFSSNLEVDIIRGNATVPWWNTSFHYRVPFVINGSSRVRINKLVELTINFTDVLVNEIGLSGLTFDNNSIRVLEFDGNSSIEIPSQFKAGEPFNSVNSSYGTLYWILNSTTSIDKIREYYVYFDIIENGQKSSASYSKPSFSFKGNTKSVSFDNSLTSASHVIINKSNNSFMLQFADGDGIFNQLYTDYQGAGSILNITMSGNRITNDNSSIVPIAIKDDDFLITNSTATVQSGHVVSFVNINSSINSITDSAAQINYTIWFAGNDIYIRARLYASFGTAETAPIDLYSNLWFAYLFDEGGSTWNNFINTLNSREYNDTHSYLTPSANLSELNAFHRSDWFSEFQSSLGGVNLYVQNFSLNNANTTIGVISFDDARLPLGTQSDGVGFNLNSDQTIAQGDIYSITVWMRFSSDGSAKAEDLKYDAEVPLVTTRKQGQQFINRTINESDANGLFLLTFNTTNRQSGFYSAVARAFKTLYIYGFNYKIFEITTDTTSPTVSAISPEGFTNTMDTTFAFNVTETNSLRNCTLILNNVLNVTNSSPINNARNTIIVYNIAEGPYNWSVNCTDTAGNVGNSNVKNITVDYTKPSIILNYPNAAQVFEIISIEFNFTAIDNLDTNLTCNLTIGGVVNRSSIAAPNGTITNLTIGGFNEGIHLWNATCTDDSLNTNVSPTRNFTVSLGPPKFFPEDTQIAINNSNPRRYNVLQISTNATDESALNLVIFSWNDTGVWVNASNISLNQLSVNYTVNVTVTAAANSLVGYVFHAKDMSNNFNTTVLRTFVVESSPPTTPTILLPANNSRNNRQPLSLNATFPADADNDAISIYYYINGRLNQTSATNTTLNASDGSYILNVSLSDGTNFSSNATVNFTIDTVKPRINSSINNSAPKRYEIVNVTANVTDESGLSSCQFIVNQSSNGAKVYINKSITGRDDKCSQNFTIALVRGNVINFTVIVNDTANNLNQSEQLVTTVNSPPSTPTILYPTSLLNTSQQPLSLNVTFTVDVDNDAITIYYYINGRLNQTSATNTTLNASDGNYDLNVSLYDGVQFSTNTTVSFTIDTTSPVTTQQYPPNNYYNDTVDPFSLLFNCSATDNLALKNISLYITNRLNQSFSFNSSARLSVTSDYSNWTLSLQSGNYTWNCLTHDISGNFDWGDNKSLLINTSLLDLKIATSDVSFNNTSPVEGDNITINATIYNLGSVTASSVVVQFFDGDPGKGGSQIDGDIVITSLAGSQNTTINMTFAASLGLHEIFVLVDPSNAITESNESNNNASKNLTVPIWHTVAGNVTGNLLLESIGNRTVFRWDISAATAGNIFVIDTDSSITWTNLTALGRNVSGGNVNNDWEELDRALNTSNASRYPDSINSTFLLNYVPVNLTSFVVFGNTIYNVSVANSTNNSDFITGILWDKSDETGDGQFNGSEDVVFVTEIRRNQTGRYGNYDFELRVPSLLKRYKGPDLGSVTFYVELR